MARAGLKWTGEDLAKASGLGLSTIKRLEQEDGYPSMRVQNLQAVEGAFLKTGKVVFEGECGVIVRGER